LVIFVIAGIVKYCCSIAIAPRIYFSNINCEDLNPEITSIIDVSRIPQKLIETELNIIAKASFGFGDVNGCIILKKYTV
jgi:3-oxoacyl-(acyl-carrier-protein) synthase